MNPERAACVSVPRVQAEKARIALAKSGLLLRDLKPSRVGDRILFPVTDPGEAGRILSGVGIEFELCESKFERRRRPKSLSEAVPGISGYMVVGSIAIINYKSEVPREDYVRAARILLKEQPRIRAVYLKLGTHGPYRLPRLELLAGEPVTETVHREYGLEFLVDVSKVYVNPRLSYEHRRVAEITRDGELVLDMFTGYAPFPIHIASLRRARVLGVDINPYAIAYALGSLERNRKKLLGEVNLMLGDSGKLDALLKPVFNRIIMNNPKESLRYVSIACRLIAGRGVIHVYKHDISMIEAVESVLEALGSAGCKVEAHKSRLVLEYAPGEGIYVIDAYVTKASTSRH